MPRKKTIAKAIVFFQLNPPLAEEIHLRWMKSLRDEICLTAGDVGGEWKMIDDQSDMSPEDVAYEMNKGKNKKVLEICGMEHKSFEYFIENCGYRKPGLDLPKGQARLEKYIKEFDELFEKYKAELKNNT